MPRRPKGQHFLLTSAARTLSLATVMRLSPGEAETLFAAIRWSATGCRPVCPGCACDAVYDCRRATGAPRWRCKACRKDFTLTSGTLFAFHKLPLVLYLAAIVIFVNEVKGKSARALSRDLGVQYKTAFVLAHKIREAMGASMKNVIIGGAGRTVEVDGCHVGGHVRPENAKKDRRDRRLAENQTGKRRVVVAMRERGGRTLTAVFASEAASVSFIKARVDGATTVHADEAADWNPLHARFDTRRINHQEAYSRNGACTNGAESFFSRLRRGENGHHHHISGVYLARYAREAAFREDHRRSANGEQFGRVVSLVTKNGPSVDFCGYWQRGRRAA
jgi:transposase-like protein